MKIFFLLILLCRNAAFSQTNLFYVTDDRETNFDAFVPSASQIEQAKQANESRPAAKDPADNWGMMTEGFQLSLSLEKDSFSNHEPVKAVVLLRNVADRPLKYFVFNPVDDKLRFDVIKDGQPIPDKDQVTTNMPLRERLAHIKIGQQWRATINPGIQRKFEADLTNLFNLLPGQYEIQARHEIMNLKQTEKTNVFSAYTKFVIQ